MAFQSPGALASTSRPGSPFKNLDSIRSGLGFLPYTSETQTERQLKVAVFDNGFLGYADEVGRTLPENTQYHAGPVAVPQPEEVHGRYMAQILASLMGAAGSQFTPELHLYNTFGYSNLKAAVDDAIARQIDVILYSQVWEYGGNSDGGGFINALVSRATDAGIVWVNAAGNFGNTTYTATIEPAADNWATLPGPNQGLPIRCEDNAAKSCNLRLVLSWNDFKDDVTEGTDKDLDLVLTDDTLNVIQTSSLVQTKNNDERPGTSKYPREIVVASVKPGLYYARVKIRSSNFGDGDRLRLTASGDFITLPKHSSKDDTLLNPADDPAVITVGATDSEKSSANTALGKPELLVPSSIVLASGDEFRGTSNSAAIVAAGLALIKSIRPDWGREELLAAVRQRPITGQGLPLEYLGFEPTGAGCFEPIDTRLSPMPAFVMQALSYGGTLVQTSAGMKIFFPYDPIVRMPGIRRNLPNDILLIQNGATGILPRSMLWQIPPYAMEVLQTPADQQICGQTQRGAGFYLPAPSRLTE